MGVRFHSVGSAENLPGTSLAFCNGIENPEDEAIASGERISQIFADREVKVFHNPTTLRDYVDRSVDQIELQLEICHQFSEFIRGEIERHQSQGVGDRDIRIILFVYSHGAVVTKSALRALTPAQRNMVEVYAFGGAVMLPKSLARKVHNYVFDADLISSLGNIRGDRDVLYNVQRINKMMKEGKNLNRAILELACENLHNHLNPRLRSSEESLPVYLEKNRRYQQIFIEKNREALRDDPYFNEQRENYSKLFEDYHITILEGTPFQAPDYAPIKRHASFKEFLFNIPENLLIAAGNLVDGAVSAGSHVYNHHVFENYVPCLERIAEEEIS